jgi:hypothetical protein
MGSILNVYNVCQKKIDGFVQAPRASSLRQKRSVLFPTHVKSVKKNKKYTTVPSSDFLKAAQIKNFYSMDS